MTSGPVVADQRITVRTHAAFARAGRRTAGRDGLFPVFPGCLRGAVTEVLVSAGGR